MSASLEQSRIDVLKAATAAATPAPRKGRASSAAKAGELEQFLGAYYRLVATEDLIARDPEELAAIALGHRAFAMDRPSGTVNVRVVNPTTEEVGWSSPHTVVQVVVDDMPFLVDSVVAALGGFDRGVHLIVHPQVTVSRSITGELAEVLTDGSTTVSSGSLEIVRESWMHLEIDRLPDAALPEVEQRLRHVLDNVRDAVEDWPKMRAHALTIASDLKAATPPGTDPHHAREASRFLEWLAHNNFTFLGYREYSLTHEDGKDVSRQVPGTGLGVLRYDRPQAGSGLILTPAASKAARDSSILIITKANSRATVHRDVYLDYISIKKFDARGECVGEQRFLGLYASAAYNDTIHDIPLLDVRAQQVLKLTGLSPESHSGKDILQILETYPRDELFQTSPEQLAEIATSVLHLQERRKTKLFLRRDEFGRFMSCLVYLPRDRYNTTVRLRIEAILLQAFGGETIDNTTRVSESTLARLHFVVRMPSGTDIPEIDEAALEQRVIDATRTWDEDLSEALTRARGIEGAARAMAAYSKALPEAYKEDFDVATAVDDLARIDRLGDLDGATGLNLYHDAASTAPEERRFKLYRRSGLSLTQVLPLFTHLGVEVSDERPYEVPAAGGRTVHIFDFGLRADPAAWGTGAAADDVRTRFEDAFRAVWEGRAESDGFNALVLGAGLTWRQVVILRTVAKYLRQTGSTFSQDYVESALVAHTGIARSLVELFEARFDPDAFPGTEAGFDQRAARQKAIVTHIRQALDDVASLDHDRIVRALLGVILASLRTNFYQPDVDGEPKSYVSLKLNPKKIPDLPAPRPMFEIWVYSPRVEGVHLRFGKVARGGLRWSDRREDFRTEILGLVKAQMVKNAVIVPTGSKGGFYAKQLPDPLVDRAAWLEEGIASYRLFISGLLDLTDNLVAGRAVAPNRVVRHDEDDTYLVVAADKGTAKFSDIANGISADYGFWLDDAFASGGSAGYDHKGMGITARGAWESVKRHFRELGVDTQSQEFTVVGVGDMSGDVFGNGMLLSEHIRLVAAFDHRHIFIDPNPDAATSYAERRRMFDLPGSSWADYDASLISAGGGVFDRAAKSVPVSAAMIAALGLRAGTKSMTPAELMKAILLAPVDLLWNGGIGTYVKAAGETNSEIGDRANDAIRVNGSDLRCKVVGEGGNLGMSQLGRIEAALAGVRVNTDAIDNSAGVDTSDHEVNIKILLTELTRSGELTMRRRNSLLASMTDEVAEHVLRDNYEQNVLLGNARAQQHAMLTVHERLIQFLEQNGDLDRALEFLPSDAEIARRQKDGLGLTSPEFSVLVAYAKLYLKNQLIATSLPDDPWFAATLAEYFPKPLRSKYAAQIAAHPLRREIITNAVANSMVNRGGITFAYRAGEETGATPEQVARAYVVCREVFDLAGFVRRVEETDNVVTTAAQTALYLEFRRLLDRSVRWFLTSRPAELDIAGEVARFRPGIKTYAARMPELLQGSERQRLVRRARELEGKGIPEDLALSAAALLDAYSLLDCIEIAEDTGESLEEVVGVYYLTSETFSIDAMLSRVTKLPRDDRWDALARGALRDDLYAVLESLCRSVLEVSRRGDDARARLDQWAGLNADALSRARAALGGIERMHHAGIAALSVALRTLRTVTRPSTASAPPAVSATQAVAAAIAATAEPTEVATEAAEKATEEAAEEPAASSTAGKPVARKTAARKVAPRKATAKKVVASDAAPKRTATTSTATQPKATVTKAETTKATKATTKKAAKQAVKKTAKKATGQAAAARG
ncbi:NAD-glutamate dehydrogenase [Intrasporangium oryzae NRRL B-24470]|uniref:NAD-glutamate dehydrogenase n=1 Tax=Intrasporangium oryzae NRRL B-24470 TaxID=1386089 RepID=W9G7L3_9MICO|nr:NAD-glutamate dehydrogenase [Intrasporangium oryzae]EWT00813.1 NAD-glutamate dehydrogenase [Intrasporangium oryzae NRRL B-24470]